VTGEEYPQGYDPTDWKLAPPKGPQYPAPQLPTGWRLHALLVGAGLTITFLSYYAMGEDSAIVAVIYIMGYRYWLRWKR
jgi:hypothetical protein